MIDNISYDDMISFSKELKASSETIKELIQNKDFPELVEFTEIVDKYSNYLKSQVEINKNADETLNYLKNIKRTSI